MCIHVKNKHTNHVDRELCWVKIIIFPQNFVNKIAIDQYTFIETMNYVCDDQTPFFSGGKQCTTEPINITNAVREALDRDMEAQKLEPSIATDTSDPPSDEETTKEATSQPDDEKQTVAEATAPSEKPEEKKDAQKRKKQ